MKVCAKLVWKYFFSNVVLQYLLTTTLIFAIDSTWSSNGDGIDTLLNSRRLERSTDLAKMWDYCLNIWGAIFLPLKHACILRTIILNIFFNRNSNFRDNCTCGIRPQEPVKIVGGVLANESFWPWAVPLVYVSN